MYDGLIMSDPTRSLSSNSVIVLEMIAAGCSYEQIISAHPSLTYLDIFRAAEEALDVSAASVTISSQPKKTYTLEEKRERHPRAYEPWTDDEDRSLEGLVRPGATVAQIAGQLGRNRGAIRSRLVKLGLVESLSAKERARFERIEGTD